MVHITVAATITIRNDDESKIEEITCNKSYGIEESKFVEPVGTDYTYNPIEVIGGELGQSEWENIRNQAQTKVDTILAE